MAISRRFFMGALSALTAGIPAIKHTPKIPPPVPKIPLAPVANVPFAIRGSAGTGTGYGGSMYWRGDGTWATPVYTEGTPDDRV